MLGLFIQLGLLIQTEGDFDIMLGFYFFLEDLTHRSNLFVLLIENDKEVIC